MTAILWHYTCAHRAPMIRRDGLIRPTPDGFAWFTDLDNPGREIIGLTMNYIKCDRLEFRFPVENDPAVIAPWMSIRRELPRNYVYALEEAPGVMPRHWFVSVVSVPILEAMPDDARAV